MDENSPGDSGGLGKAKSKVLTVAGTAAVVSAAFVLVIAAILSPSFSPLASIHDSDGDGYADSVDEFPDDESEWGDLDGDGVGDNSDAFADDPGETSDSDSDGVGDNSDVFPEDSSEWEDTDGDSVGDNSDVFPEDQGEWNDTDGDGVGDNSDEFPEDPEEWEDADSDGVGDNTDAFPEDPDRDSPEVTLEAELQVDGVTLVFTSVAPEFEWDDLAVTLSAGQDSVTWETENDDLDGWGTATTQIYETYVLDGLDVSLMALDMTGDGMVSAFDGLAVFPYSGSFDSDTVYSIVIEYEPTHEELENSTFSFDLETPTATLSDVHVIDGVRVIFVAVPENVSWSDLRILLTDGTDLVSWDNMTSEDLDDGLADLHSYGTVTLGTLDVTMTATDLIGNGLVDYGDYFALAAASFSPDTVYEATVIYEPTDGTMASCTFTG